MLLSWQKRWIAADYAIEAEAKEKNHEDRLCLRQARSQAILQTFKDQLFAWKSQLLPKHPMAEAVHYALNQWQALNAFVSDGADAYVTMLTQFSTEGSFETARRTLAYLPQHPTWPCEWWQCYIPLFYEYLLHTGDYEFVQSHYAFLRDETSFHPLMKDGLIRNCPREPVVDWPASCRDGYEFGEANAVVNAYAYWDLEILGRLAHFLHRESEVEALSRIATQLRSAFNHELFDESTGLYVDSVGSRHSSFHANMYALRFGLVPEERVGRCLKFVKSKGMACSVFTAQFLLETLFKFGEEEAAVALMTRDGERSWMEMLQNGATVTTESWLSDNKPNMSWAHPWGSSPANVIVRYFFWFATNGTRLERVFLRTKSRRS